MKKRLLRTALVAIVLLLVLGAGWVLAEDTGWNNPSSNAVDSGGGFSTDPSGAYTDGSGYAEGGFDGGGTAKHLYWDYGLNIPACARIDGIEVRLDWWLSSISGDTTMSVELSWDGGSTWTAAKTDTQRTLAEHTVVLGGSGVDWGHTWTPDQLSNDNFRARVTVYDSST